MRILMILLLILGGCAPMPSSSLFPGVAREAALEDVLIVRHVGLIETSTACSKNAPASQVILNCLLNGCIVLGCATVEWDAEGIIRKCEVYTAFDQEYLVEHELQHCKGYADEWY